MEGFDDGGRELARIWTPLSKTDLPSWVHDGEEGGGERKECAEN